MAIDIITKEDLEEFRVKLLSDLKKSESQTQKKWLKSYEVRKLLGISPGTLQNLRINGTLKFSKIGNLMFYNYEDIERLFENNLSSNAKTAKKSRNTL